VNRPDIHFAISYQLVFLMHEFTLDRFNFQCCKNQIIVAFIRHLPFSQYECCFCFNLRIFRSQCVVPLGANDITTPKRDPGFKKIVNKFINTHRQQLIWSTCATYIVLKEMRVRIDVLIMLRPLP
jgi:hypothetical protein